MFKNAGHDETSIQEYINKVDLNKYRLIDSVKDYQNGEYSKYEYIESFNNYFGGCVFLFMASINEEWICSFDKNRILEIVDIFGK